MQDPSHCVGKGLVAVGPCGFRTGSDKSNRSPLPRQSTTDTKQDNLDRIENLLHNRYIRLTGIDHT